MPNLWLRLVDILHHSGFTDKGEDESEESEHRAVLFGFAIYNANPVPNSLPAVLFHKFFAVPHSCIATDKVRGGLYRDGNPQVHFSDELDDNSRKGVADAVPRRCHELGGLDYRDAPDNVQENIDERDDDIS